MRFHKTIAFLALLLTTSAVVLAQQPTPVQTTPVPGSASPEEALEQVLHRIAAVYREMAAVSPSDPPAMRDLKNQLARLAEEQEKAASAANAMAAYHAQLVALIRQSVTISKAPKHPNYGDAAFRR